MYDLIANLWLGMGVAFIWALKLQIQVWPTFIAG